MRPVLFTIAGYTLVVFIVFMGGALTCIARNAQMEYLLEKHSAAYLAGTHPLDGGMSFIEGGVGFSYWPLGPIQWRNREGSVFYAE